MAYADVSLASTSVSNPVFGAPTNFYFDSWIGGSAGTNDQSSRTSASATAALGNAASETSLPQPASTGGAASPAAGAGVLGAIPPTYLLLGIAGVVAIVATVYILKH